MFKQKRNRINTADIRTIQPVQKAGTFNTILTRFYSLSLYSTNSVQKTEDLDFTITQYHTGIFTVGNEGKKS